MRLQSVSTAMAANSSLPVERLQAAVVAVDEGYRNCDAGLAEAADLYAAAKTTEAKAYQVRTDHVIGAVALLQEAANDETIAPKAVARTFSVIAERVNGYVPRDSGHILQVIGGLRAGRPVISVPYVSPDSEITRPAEAYDPKIGGLLLERPQLVFSTFDTQDPQRKAIGMNVSLQLESAGEATTVELSPLRIAALVVGQRAIRARRDSLGFEQVINVQDARHYRDNIGSLEEFYDRITALNTSLRAHDRQPISLRDFGVLLLSSRESSRLAHKERQRAVYAKRAATPANRLARQYARSARRTR